MPNYTEKKAYTVPIKLKGSPANYVFLSNVDMTNLGTDAGVTEIKTVSDVPSVAFVNANCPKPPRCIKKVSAGTKSTFCDPVVAASKGIKSVGGKVSRSIHLESGSSKVVSVYVVTGGVKRAWNMAKTQHAKIKADFGQLGIEACKGTDVAEYVWGCSAPYPAIARKAGVDDVFTTFCADANIDSLTTWGVVSNNQSVAQFLGLAAAPTTP